MIIATAGHVDHGKTALLQAITGINADRLPEEKARGMTIDLGYAYWPQPDGRVIGFIDVPGHEKFLANMLCGMGGIDYALLVVAADDGIMPQTREHLNILQLSGSPRLIVAITKSDLADSTQLDRVVTAITTLTQQSGWESITLFITSTTSKAGISELAAFLGQLPERHVSTEKPFRLAIDRVFNVKGAGLVVTGTALSGEICTGETLWVTGANRRVRIRGLHAQNQPSTTGREGERIALNITGDIEKSDLTRGDWLLTQPPAEAFQRVIVELNSISPLKQGQSLHLHHAASHITGRVSLLSATLAELTLDNPLYLADNDRLILRDINAQETLASARVIQLTPRKRGKRRPDYLAWLHALASSQSESQHLALLLQSQPCKVQDLCWARQLSESALFSQLTPLSYLQAGDYLLLTERARYWQNKLLETLSLYHQQHSDRPGLGKDRLRRMSLPTLPDVVGMSLIEQLSTAGELSNRLGWLHLPDFSVRYTPQEAALWQRIAPLFTDDPWWARDLAKELRLEETLVRQTLHKAAQAEQIVAIVKDRYYHHDQMVRFANLIRSRAEKGQNTIAADFRDALGTGRKLAIQVLEFFDRCGFTRRKGNEHLLRDATLFIRHIDD
ncbi:MAG: Selenocysteine-specific elongation factor [Candidatus Erwinia impunctatus]|nr:Selenocysteine-specific elongation factor [Culicoides impunctatus]